MDGILPAVFTIYDNGLGEYAFTVNIGANLEFYKKPGTADVPSYCEFATHNFLTFFEYQDSF